LRSGAVSVSVISHGHGQEILTLLRQFAQLDVPEVARVVVTLNLPEPHLSDGIEDGHWPFALDVIRNERPQGFGHNHNQAFLRCDTEFFCVINPDISLVDDPFPDLIRTLGAVDAGCAYPLQLDVFGRVQDHVREVPTPGALLRRYLIPRYDLMPQPRHWINGAFMLFRAEVYRRLEGFDEHYFMYCDDVDICLRLQLAGYRLVRGKSATVQHQAQRASRTDLRHLLWHIQSLWYMWRSPAYRQFLNSKLFQQH
jgi:N-acetylglucosaminyl-diphospho-decaprenol L-rhamnosyltransferase